MVRASVPSGRTSPISRLRGSAIRPPGGSAATATPRPAPARAAAPSAERSSRAPRRRVQRRRRRSSPAPPGPVSSGHDRPDPPGNQRHDPAAGPAALVRARAPRSGPDALRLWRGHASKHATLGLGVQGALRDLPQPHARRPRLRPARPASLRGERRPHRAAGHLRAGRHAHRRRRAPRDRAAPAVRGPRPRARNERGPRMERRDPRDARRRPRDPVPGVPPRPGARAALPAGPRPRARRARSRPGRCCSRGSR